MASCALLLALAAVPIRAEHGPQGLGGPSFVNWETPHVHPLDLTPDRSRLLAVNTPDNRLEVFDVTGGTPVAVGSVPVGLDPVTVRALDDATAWVVNQISDSISLVDLATLNVVATVTTADEPADVVFAGDPLRAFVTCAQASLVQVFTTASPTVPLTTLEINAEEPRAMAVSPDGARVYVAIFESGNGSTVLAGNGFLDQPQIVSHPSTPYGGANPPPNQGPDFFPPMNPANPPPPSSSLMIKKNAVGQWMDDNGGDWTLWVSGANASMSGRPVGWDLPDHDVAIIETDTLGVSYINRLMNICMAIAVNPATERVTVVGTDAINEIRFEPVLSGRFLRVNVAQASLPPQTNRIIHDLNPHLTYTTDIPFEPIPQLERDRSIGDPRGIVWNSAGTRGYVTGMGSNNLIVINSNGVRVPPVGQAEADPIELPEGPTGVAIDDVGGRLYVLAKFASSIATIDLATETVIDESPLHDPSPPAIKIGRKHQYDTHKNSGLGHIACASCHVDSRTDRLSWDLGNPAGDMKPFDQNCDNRTNGTCPDWHPMKGPMTTQTLQDIIGKEPHHWRGDRNGIEEFNPAFEGLLGDDTQLTPDEMQQYEDFLATIYIPPNPFREFDNTLPELVPLPGHVSAGRYSPAGTPLVAGNPQQALINYRTGLLLGGTAHCVTCHTLPTGVGSTFVLDPSNGQITNLPPGPDGGLHHTVSRNAGSALQTNFKVPQLRTLYKKVGMSVIDPTSRSGFGFIHDGTVDSIARFLSIPSFVLADDQELADMIAFMLSFTGSDLPTGSPTNALEFLGPPGNDTHAAVGAQITFDGLNNLDPTAVERLDQMVALAEAQGVGLVAKGRQASLQRGYSYLSGGVMQSDRLDETVEVSELRLAAQVGEEITFTVVPKDTELRIGVDRDEDGHLDRDELDACSNPADAASVPGAPDVTLDFDFDGDVDLADYDRFAPCLTGPCLGPSCDKPLYAHPCCVVADANADGDVDAADYAAFSERVAD